LVIRFFRKSQVRKGIIPIARQHLNSHGDLYKSPGRISFNGTAISINNIESAFAVLGLEIKSLINNPPAIDIRGYMGKRYQPYEY
jgi:hypothetical protein